MTTKQTTLIDNFQASPLVASNAGNLSGRVRTINGTVALATGDLDAADIVLLAPIPSNARVLSIRLAADDLDGHATPTLAWNVGLHDTAEAVVDADAYASAVILGQAATAFTEYAFEARNINACGQAVWEDAGVSEDPGGHYLLSLTVSTVSATPAAGDLSFIVEYAIN